MTQHVTVKYFAMLREAAERDEEILVISDDETGATLYGKLKARYQFALDLAEVRLAINEEFRPLSERLTAGDDVVFIPPVAGG